MTTPQRVCLVVLDGFGERAEQKGNAIRLAKTPAFDRIYKTSPWTLIGASENDVGLPKGQMGNSEVGHLNLGAGRIVYQDIVRIDKAIETGTFYENPVLVKLVDAAKASGGTLHLFGPDQPRQRSRRAGARLRRLRAGQAPRADQGGLARVPRRARHAAALGRRLPAPGRRKAEGDRRRRAGLGGRPLLRHGPRQALGPAGGGVEDADPRRRAAGRRPGRRRRARLRGRRRGRQGAHRRVRDAALAQGRRTARRARSSRTATPASSSTSARTGRGS